jgi:hypothetical protein
MPRAQSHPAAQQARFVFKGTVQRLGETTVRYVTVSRRTAVVRVDEVIRAPQTLSAYAGHEITVDCAGPHTLAVGQQALFYAAGWIFGESLAVQALEHLPIEASHFAAAIAQVAADPVTNLAEFESRARFAAAEVVVSGQVVSVTLAIGAAAAARATARGGAALERCSEHVPLWRDAIVSVQAVHKGRHAGKRAVIRFPASTDVLWHRAPKFRPGDEGFFMLHRGELKRAAAGRAMTMAATDTENNFTALHPADFQPFDRPGGVRNLIAASAATAPAAKTTRRSPAGGAKRARAKSTGRRKEPARGSRARSRRTR